MASVRLRQAVIAARDLAGAAGQLRDRLDLGEPFSDPGVGYFGLRNAVFALGDTFLELVSPVRGETAAGRLLDRRGGDCGYMLMFHVQDLAAARERARAEGVREVFEVSLEDIEEVHLHPADMRGAIVSLSRPVPPEAWRWGGPNWEARAARGRVAGAGIAVADPGAVRARWEEILGAPLDVSFVADPAERGLVEISIAGSGFEPFDAGRVRFVPQTEEEEG
jgi:hypothetical protein